MLFTYHHIVMVVFIIPQNSLMAALPGLYRAFVVLRSACSVMIAYDVLQDVKCIIYIDDFKKVSKAVAGVELNDHLVDLVFVIFDENGMTYTL